MQREPVVQRELSGVAELQDRGSGERLRDRADPVLMLGRRLLTGLRVGVLRPGVLRVATYLGVGDDDVERAVELIPRALSVVART